MAQVSISPRPFSTRILALRTDINSANLAAGLTTGLWYAFAGVSIHLEVVGRLNLPPVAAASWFFIICVTAAVSGVILTLVYRQPLAFAASLPGWVLLAALGGRYSLSEMAGASLLAGVLIVALGPLKVGERLMAWLPLPIVMGMFAGSVLGYATAIFKHLGAEPATIGLAILGYLGTRAIKRPWLPPVGAAAAMGLAAATVLGQAHPEALRWSPPVVAPLWPTFNLESFFALSIPLALMAVGIGNVQGIGFLASQGYRPPINLLTFVVGINSVINAMFGGHPSTIARNGVAIVAGEDAGPRERRYVGNLIASFCLLLLGLSATTASSLPGVLPASLVATLAGLAILGALSDALKKTVITDLPIGAFFAFAIAASPLTILGIGSAFWALVGGWLVSLLLERSALERALASPPAS